MSVIEGKIKSTIFYNDTNGFLVALFRVSKSDDKNLLKKTITITGNILDLKMETLTVLNGEFINHEKFGKQFKFDSYEYIIPSESDDIVEFLSSSFIKGCGKATAKKIVDVYGNKAIDIIKENKYALDNIDGMNESKRDKIYDAIINYSKSSDLILKLKNMGFSIEEAGKIYLKYKGDLEDIINNNIYLLNDIVDFKRLDNIFLNNYKDKLDKRRVKACLIETMKYISINKGDIYYDRSLIYEVLGNLYSIHIDSDIFNNYLKELEEEQLIVVENERYYLQNNYEDEIKIAELLKKIDNKKITKNNYDLEISALENKLNITYNDDQKKAITNALNNNITIIFGGPGTGKTTIINAIVKLYIKQNHLNELGIIESIALLAPTGRASKKMSLATSLGASTIHRFLKWNKDTNSFGINENYRNPQKLIIVDEVSMIDNSLFASLLKGINSYVKLVLVGDINQLPAVGPGLVLNDLINSDLFSYIPLNLIYRQSDNSYIPYLAREIKNKELSEKFITKKDDYNFLPCNNEDIIKTITSIIKAGIEKGYDENNLQVLVPIYKGENGIDNLNKILQDIFNKETSKSIEYGDITYKNNDKVLQLVNDTDNNVFNGDIGFIIDIKTIYLPRKKEIIVIDFDGNIVNYEKKDLNNIRHAYAISIHKSQGSEFDHVIMPITFQYGQMLYNKLLYTGVSRAKKSLILVGDPKAFYKGINNEYGNSRLTTLKEKIIEIFNT